MDFTEELIRYAAALCGDTVPEAFLAALRQESVQYIDQSRLALHDGGTEHGARFEEMTLPWAKRALYTILSVVQRPIRHLL